MNKQLFNTVLLWALFALHILCSAPVVGQTTTSVTPVVTFPSELPIGTNYLEKLTALRATNAKFSVYGYMFFDISGVQELVALSSKRGQGGVSINLPTSATDEELLLGAAPVANEFLADGVTTMNSRYNSEEGTIAIVRVELMIDDVSSDTKLFSAVWWRYLLKDEDGVFKTQDLISDEVQVVPAFENDPKGYFRYYMPNNTPLNLGIENILLDAIGPEGPDTCSSLTGGLPPTRIGSFSLPSKYIDGSYTGKLYLQLYYSPEGEGPYEQVLAVDLQSGKIERPQIQFSGIRRMGPYTQNGQPMHILRASYLVPRGTSFSTQVSTNSYDGPWKYYGTVTAGAGGSAPLVNFETGVNFEDKNAAGFIKAVVNDRAYPDYILRALPSP